MPPDMLKSSQMLARTLVRRCPVCCWHGVPGVFEAGWFLAVVVEGIGVAISAVDGDIMLRIYDY